VLAIIDKMGPALDENRSELEKLMAEHDCAPGE